MTSRCFVALALVLVALTQLTGCLPREEGIYRGGVLIRPGPLALGDHYTFTFLGKWRISHAWLSGPPEIDYCQYSRRDNGRGADRFFEVEGQLRMEYVAGAKATYGQKFISNPRQFIYGTDRNGKFVGYLPFCTHVFTDIWTGVSVALIKPDPTRKTDAWIAGARPVTFNGLTWLEQIAPLKEDPMDHTRGRNFFERWVLMIPDTPYWLVMTVGGSESNDGKGFGIDRDPQKYARLLDLFHLMVMSVQLEPINLPAESISPALQTESR